MRLSIGDMAVEQVASVSSTPQPPTSHDPARMHAGERSQLVEALIKNVYGGDATMRPFAQLMAKYLNQEAACLELTPADAIYRGHVKFTSDIRS